MRKKNFLTVILALCAMSAVVRAVYAGPAIGTYDFGDIAAINAIIANNGLNWTMAPTDGTVAPDNWTGVTWSNDAPYKRVLKLAIRTSNLTGTLDLSALTELTELQTGANPQLTGIVTTGLTKLQSLELDGNNNVKTLDLSTNTGLLSLTCNYTGITSLDVSYNTALTWLSCGYNKFTSLDVSKNTQLSTLICKENQLAALDLSKNTALKYLYCNNNQLTELDVSKNTALEELYCNDNQLTALDVTKNTALADLHCEYNGLTSLDLTKNTALTDLHCQGNALTSLDVTKNTALSVLYLPNNKLTGIDVSNITALSTYYAASQTPALSLNLNHSTNKYELTIDLNSPTDLAAGLTYDGSKLIADDATVESSSFTVSAGAATRTLSGTLSLSYTDIPLYNPGDVAVINNIIKDNGLNWTPADPADGSYVPPNWTGITWSGDEYNKRITEINGSNASLSGILDASGLSELVNLNVSGNTLTGINITGNTKLTILDVSTNKLTALNVAKNSVLQELNCENNQLLGIDLSAQKYSLNKFCGDYQKPVITLYKNNNTGKYDRSITLNSPTNLATGLVYDQYYPKLIADDQTVTSSPFTVATKMTGPTLSGTMTINFSDEMQYNAHDVQAVNNMITNNGETELSLANPADGSYIPLSWVRAVFWSDAEKDKRIVRFYMTDKSVSKMSGTLDVSNLTELADLTAPTRGFNGVNLTNTPNLVILDFTGQRMNSIDLSGNPKLNGVWLGYSLGDNVSTIDVSNNPALVTLTVQNNHLTYLDLSKNTALAHFDGSYQSVDLTLYHNSFTGKYERTIALNNPTTLADGLKYENGKLIADDSTTVKTSPFVVETGRASMTLSGTLTLTYSEPPYHQGDIAFINDLIDNHSMDWPKADPADGSYVPSEWVTINAANTSCLKWSADASNKRIIDIGIYNGVVSGDVDLSPLDSLARFVCRGGMSGGNLTGIDVSKNTALTTLDVGGGNKLTSVDVSHNTALTLLSVSQNPLTRLDVSKNTQLASLFCAANQLTVLDVSQNTNLVDLGCQNNQLTSLDVSMLPLLEFLQCDNNRLITIDLSKNPKMDTFTGGGQTPTVVLQYNAATDKFERTIALNNPTTLATGLTYSDGKLIADDSTTVKTSPFAVETGISGKSLSGTLTLRYGAGYEITYDYNGGTDPGNPESYSPVSDDITLKNPTRAGKTFVGWTGTDLAALTLNVVIPTGSTGDRHYTAHWSYSFSDDPTAHGVSDTIFQCEPPYTLKSGGDGVSYKWTIPGGGTATSDTLIATRAGRYYLETNYGTITTKDSILMFFAFDPSTVLLDVSTEPAQPTKRQTFLMKLNPLSDSHATLNWKITGATTIEYDGDSVHVVRDSDGTISVTVTVQIAFGTDTCSKIFTLDKHIYGASRLFFVDDSLNSSTDGDGSSWQSAFTSLDDALAAAVPGDVIWVAAGHYKPKSGSFNLATDGVEIYGGFKGTESRISDRNYATNKTYLEGSESGGPVIINTGVTKYARWDGFVVEGGKSETSGGGILNINSSPVIANCVIRSNTAKEGGGGIAALGPGSAPFIYNTEISGNTASYGGGAYFSFAGLSILTNITVSGNYATSAGGGIYCEGFPEEAHPEFRNSIIYGNRSVAVSVNEVSGASEAIYRSSIVGGSGGSEAWQLHTGIDGNNNYDNDPRFIRNGFDSDGKMTAGNYSFKAVENQPPYNRGNDDFLEIGEYAIPQSLLTPHAAGITEGKILYDLSGWAREINGICDIGAYEYNPDDPNGINEPNAIIPVAKSATKLWCYEGQLYIQPTKPVKVWIYTIMGMLYRELEVENQTTVPLPIGAYIVRANDGATAKVVSSK